MIFERLLNNIKKNYQTHISGGYNFIPIGFDRFSKYLPGVVKSTYTIVTASSGVAKSKFTRFYYLFNVIEFVKNNPRLKVHIDVFSLELSDEEYIADIICAFLKRDFDIDISYRELLSIFAKGEDIKINQEIIDKIETYNEWFETFNSHVTIYTTIKNPYGIYKTCKDTIHDFIKGKESTRKNNKGQEEKYWKYDDDNYFYIGILDHIGLIQPEKIRDSSDTMTLHQAISKLSSDYILHLKNYYQAHFIVVQQQAADKERVQLDMSGKSVESKLEPSLDGLGDNKLTQRDATEVIGIFAPDRYDIKNHAGYNITLMRDTYRSVKLLKSRYGSPNKKIGMLFNGATGTFEEMPKSDEFSVDRDYIKFLTEKGFIKDESKSASKSEEVIVRSKIRLGDFKEED